MSEHELLLSDFDFDLPADRIAQFPLADRSASRLLHVLPDRLEDWHFRDIVNLLRPDDLLVMNNTKVIKARLLGKKETGGAVEVLIERITGENTAIAMARASKSPKAGTFLIFEAENRQEKVEVTGREGEFFALRFEFGGQFADGGRFARAVDAYHQNDKRLFIFLDDKRFFARGENLFNFFG